MDCKIKLWHWNDLRQVPVTDAHTFIQNRYCKVHSATAACVHTVHTYTPQLTPNTKHKSMYRSQADHVQLMIPEVLTTANVKIWPHVTWHREYQNSAIHLPEYGVTSHKIHNLWALRFYGGTISDSGLLWCDASSLGEGLLQATCSFKTLEASHPMAQHYIPEDWNAQNS